MVYRYACPASSLRARLGSHKFPGGLSTSAASFGFRGRTGLFATGAVHSCPRFANDLCVLEGFVILRSDHKLLRRTRVESDAAARQERNGRIVLVAVVKVNYGHD